MPAEFVRAIVHAQTVLSWQENVLDQSEVPPEWMWPFDEELEHWFDEVDRKRRSKYGNDGEDSGEIEGDVIENELAKAMR